MFRLMGRHWPSRRTREQDSRFVSNRSLLRASVRQWPQRLLSAVLVSDEVVEADLIQTSFLNGDRINGDVEEVLLPSTRQRLEMMEELLENQEEEKDTIIQELKGYKRRERILKVISGLSILIIIALVVVIAIG